jgi:hypothetical protein
MTGPHAPGLTRFRGLLLPREPRHAYFVVWFGLVDHELRSCHDGEQEPGREGGLES